MLATLFEPDDDGGLADASGLGLVGLALALALVAGALALTGVA